MSVSKGPSITKQSIINLKEVDTEIIDQVTVRHDDYLIGLMEDSIFGRKIFEQSHIYRFQKRLYQDPDIIYTNTHRRDIELILSEPSFLFDAENSVFA